MRGNEAHEDACETIYVPRHRAKRQGILGFAATAVRSRKVLITAGVAGALALGTAGWAVALSGSPAPETELAATAVDRADAANAANRSLDRSAALLASPSAAPKPTASPKPKVTVKPKPKVTVRVNPAPVAGLDKVQMNNAAIIVEVARSTGMPKRAMIIAVATGMQESDLYNNASEAVPESLNYPHEGTSVDHDSVGVFQQRTSSGWGSVKNLMNPRYQARNFFTRLNDINWQNMSLTQAAQAVQISAYPNAYAKHETRATTIVGAFF